MADPIAEELKTATDNIAALERTHRAAHAEMEKEIAEELAEFNKRAPSIVSPEYQKWKAQKAELERDIAWRRLDASVINNLAVDTHALRSGPLGYDVDGREYWHLREYQEKMPRLTEGRYAWCLVVLGPAFPVDPNQPKEEEAKEGDDAAEEKEAENGDDKSAVKAEAKDVGDDSGLTSLDASVENDAATGGADADGDVKMGLPTSAAVVKSETNGHEAVSTTRICMGANNPLTIKTLTEYISYRLEQVEYEENVSMQEREKAARLAKEEGATSDSPADADEDGEDNKATGGAESMYGIRKAKLTLKDTQEERRKQVQQLIKRLNKSKEYFAWHRRSWLLEGRDCCMLSYHKLKARAQSSLILHSLFSKLDGVSLRRVTTGTA